MVDELSNFLKPDLDSGKAVTLVREGLVGYVGRHNISCTGGEIAGIVLHGEYAPWALSQLESNGYRDASVSDNGVLKGIHDGLWHVNIDELVQSYGGS
jgi:hypothetical protein